MGKLQLIAAIRRHNPSATSEFLNGFSETSLYRYLEHLRYGRRPRGPRSSWVRTGETPAVVAWPA